MKVEEPRDRLRWLAGRAPAPALAADLGVDAVTADHGHPMGPEALVGALAESLAALHLLPLDDCPFPADTATLRAHVDDRIDQGRVAVTAEGPYAGRSPVELAGIFDDLMDDLGDSADPVFVHGTLAPERIWLDPSGQVTFLGWHRSGIGDRHVDLAAAASVLTRLHGAALVGPFFEAYGFDHVDLRRLDAHQILAHLLT